MSDTREMRTAIQQAGPVLVGALLLVGLYLAVREAVGPFMLLLALVALLYPYRTMGWARGFLATGLLFFALWFIYQTQTVLTPVALSLLAAYLLDPFIDRLEQRKIPRTLGILALLAAAILLVGLALLVIVPVLVDQISTLSGNLPEYVARTREWINATALPFLERMGFDVRPEALSEALFGEQQQAGATVQRILGGALEVTSGAYAVLAQLLNILLIPIITFYLLKDYDAMASWTMGLIPPRKRALVREVGADLGAAVGNFLRGQLAVSLIIAVLYGIGFAIIGLQYAALLGLAAGVLSLVPYVGSVLTAVLAALVAILGPSPWSHLLGVVVIYGAVQLLDANIITPKVMGDRVGLHPVVVLIAILVFATLLGFVGLLIAVPLTAMIKVGLDRAIDHWRASAAFAEAKGTEAGEVSAE